MKAAFPVRSARGTAFDPQHRREGDAGPGPAEVGTVSPSDATAWQARAADVAHEIRNPLAAVSQAVGLLRRIPELDGDNRELIDLALHEIARMDRIVEDLLEQAAPSADTWAPTRIDELVRRVLRSVRNDPRCGPGVEIDLHTPTGEIEAVARPDRIEQLLWNLLSNALDALAGRGRISIELTRRTRRERAGIVVSVTDDGAGLPSGARRLLFEPCFTGRSEGHGLGLAVCKRIVEQHRGAIGIEPADRGERGTRAWFWIPEHRSEAPDEERDEWPGSW